MAKKQGDKVRELHSAIDRIKWDGKDAPVIIFAVAGEGEAQEPVMFMAGNPEEIRNVLLTYLERLDTALPTTMPFPQNPELN